MKNGPEENQISHCPWPQGKEKIKHNSGRNLDQLLPSTPGTLHAHFIKFKRSGEKAHMDEQWTSGGRVDRWQCIEMNATLQRLQPEMADVPPEQGQGVP